MAYQDLRKLRYIDESIYHETFHQRVNSPETIKLDFTIAGKQAFFCQSQDVIKKMYSILRLDRKIFSLCRNLPGKALEQYSKKCLIDEIVITNNIEGVHSSRKEIGEALSVLEDQSKKKGKQPRFTGLVNK